MQCPPMPGPGRNGMNPKGFVDAASITSHALMSIFSNASVSSLTRAMFTARKMFSSIFVASAVRQSFTGTTLLKEA